MSASFEISYRAPDGAVRRGELASALAAAAPEAWLFVSPHDDDWVIGAGLLAQAVLAAGGALTVAVATDGRMGYCDVSDRDRIVDVRRRETEEALALLGGGQLRWLGYPDGSLHRHAGRVAAVPGDVAVRAGHTGLQNSLTALLREVRPARVFAPTVNDMHPDHKTVFQELQISLFHAAGAIWPELGEPLAAPPALFEMAVYCDFDGEPNLRLDASGEAFAKKLAAIAAFRSQRQIARVVEAVEQGGPLELFREVRPTLYSAARHARVLR